MDVAIWRGCVFKNDDILITKPILTDPTNQPLREYFFIVDRSVKRSGYATREAVNANNNKYQGNVPRYLLPPSFTDHPNAVQDAQRHIRDVGGGESRHERGYREDKQGRNVAVGRYLGSRCLAQELVVPHQSSPSSPRGPHYEPNIKYDNREPRSGEHSSSAAGGRRDTNNREHGGDECVITENGRRGGARPDCVEFQGMRPTHGEGGSIKDWDDIASIGGAAPLGCI